MILREVMLDELGEEVAPSTQERGSAPIDSILCLTNIDMVNEGYLSFGEGAGDYRPLLIDIDETSLFEESGSPSTKLRVRRFKMSDPWIIRKYLSLLKKHYKKENMFIKMYDLNCIPIKYPIEKNIAEKYEEIDQIQLEGMHHAENKYRKFNAGKVLWSSEITLAYHIIKLWPLIVRQPMNKKVNACTILWMTNKAGYVGNTNLNLEDTKEQLIAVYNSCKSVVKNNQMTQVKCGVEK